MDSKEKRMAVLIDSENVSSKYIKYILDEISNYGIATYKRIYGDWTSKTAPNWKAVAVENSITPIQQYVYTKGKNATDSAMIIDAMDILYSGNVDGFCLVSSDSDFTRLASRLRESGMLVVGMGEKKTNEAFIASCTLFRYLEVLAAEEDEETIDASEKPTGRAKSGTSKENTKTAKTSVTPKKTIEAFIVKIITDNDEKGRQTTPGEIGSKLSSRYSDFDARNYGYSQLSRFLDSCKSIYKKTNGKATVLVVAKSETTFDEVVEAVREMLTEVSDHKMNLSEVKRKLEKRFQNFNIRDYSYTKFSQFINDMSVQASLTVEGNYVKLI
ncbi:MAG: NYN domain-containing protein [Clostridia bacterium]|mgnify:CR=1 FL=1|nr:NYN domain-containing protein [Clostridia bacterium]